jgi:integrase
VEFFGGIWTWAGRRGLVSAANPVRGVERAAHGTCERILSDEEMAALGQTLQETEALQPLAAAAIRLIAYTGMRYEEAQGLRWSEVNLVRQCLLLEETKTGRSIRPLGNTAAEFLRELRDENQTEWVFPNAEGSRPATLAKHIADLFDAAGVSDARSQVLRRTFASTAAAEGYSDAVVGELIGHARRGVTTRHYIRLPERIVISAANCVSAKMAAALNGKLQLESPPLEALLGSGPQQHSDGAAVCLG